MHTYRKNKNSIYVAKLSYIVSCIQRSFYLVLERPFERSRERNSNKIKSDFFKAIYLKLNLYISHLFI